MSVNNNPIRDVSIEFAITKRNSGEVDEFQISRLFKSTMATVRKGDVNSSEAKKKVELLNFFL